MTTEPSTHRQALGWFLSSVTLVSCRAGGEDHLATVSSFSVASFRAARVSISLGSQQGNRHLHWHLAPLPPGVPYEQQQYYALMAEHGVLDVSEQEQADLAARIRTHLGS